MLNYLYCHPRTKIKVEGEIILLCLHRCSGIHWRYRLIINLRRRTYRSSGLLSSLHIFPCFWMFFSFFFSPQRLSEVAVFSLTQTVEASLLLPWAHSLVSMSFFCFVWFLLEGKDMFKYDQAVRMSRPKTEGNG